MPIIETTKNHFLEQFEQHIDDVLTWDEQTSHSAEPTFLLLLDICVWQREAKGHVQSWFISLQRDWVCFNPEVLDIAVTARVHTQCKFASR